jgi:hypothetical protein
VGRSRHQRRDTDDTVDIFWDTARPVLQSEVKSCYEELNRLCRRGQDVLVNLLLWGPLNPDRTLEVGPVFDQDLRHR